MLIIFLITDISMVGIFAGVYGNIAKYREGMLMGVHIPKSELEHPDVKELLQLYKKRNRQFYLWNMLAGIAVCQLCGWIELPRFNGTDCVSRYTNQFRQLCLG